LNQLRRIIKVRPGEGTRTLILFAQYFLVVAVTIAGKSARDTFFLSRYDRALLPLMFAGCAIAVAAAAALYSRLSRKLKPIALLDASNLLFAAGLLALQFRLSGHAIPLLYVWIEITVAIISLSFWLAASEMFDPRQAKRLFGLIGGGGAVAAILVGSGVKPFVKAFGPDSILVVVLAALAGQWALGRYSHRFTHAQPAPLSIPRKQTPGKRFDSYLVSIALVVALSAIASQVVDYQFKLFAAQAIPNEVNLASFFGHFYAFTGGATLLVQFFLTSTILSRFGLLAGALALPAFLNVGAVAVLLRPVLGCAIIGKFADQTLKFTLNNSALELLWLPIPAPKRKAVRPVISGTVKYVAESASGLCTFFLVGYTGLQYLSLVTVVVVGAWTLIAFRLRTLYVSALVSALEKRSVDFEDLSLDAQDPAFIGIVEKALNSRDELQQLSALELIEGLDLSHWERALRASFSSGSAAVKKKLLEIAASEPGILSDTQVLTSLREEKQVALEAIHTAATRRLAEAGPAFGELIRGADPQIKAAAAAALFVLGDSAGAAEAAAVLRQLVCGPDPACRAAALPHLADRPDLLPSAGVAALLRDASREVRQAALQSAAARRDISLIEAVVQCLDDPRTAPFAQDALRSLPVEQVVAQLEVALARTETSAFNRIGILRALAKFPIRLSAPLLINAITPQDLDASAQAVHSLLQLTRDVEIPETLVGDLPRRGESLLRSAYHYNRMLRLLDAGAAGSLLCSDLRDRIRHTIPTILAIEMLCTRQRSLADAANIALDGDPAKIPLLLELLDNVLSLEKRASICPLLEPLSLEERDSTGARLYPDLPQRPEPEIEKSIYSPREWESAISIDHLWRTGSAQALMTLNWRQVPDHRLTQEVRAVVENQLKEMYSTLEKTILLKSVSLFADLPVEKLAKIAQVTEETWVPKGASVMKEGEFGDSLFILADGVVRVHKGGQNLARLKKGDCVGEMALLDHSPRSADVTVEEDATLLRIGREDFNEVTIANPEIMQGIVRLLARRLREANEKLSRQ
jgi:ATP/ADP translocase